MMQTDKTQYAGTGAMLARADYPAAINQIETAKETAYTHKDRVVYYLDIGMLHHWNGDYTKSNEFLEKAERAIEENFTKSMSRSASSLILNDNALSYEGEDYEDIYLNAFKAINYLALGETDQAFVEVRRINNKHIQLEERHAEVARKLNEAEEAHETFIPGKSPFHESALGRYLSLILYRNEGQWDDVRIDLEKIAKGWKTQPHIYPFDIPSFAPSVKRIHAPKARLNVLAFTGRAPEKEASTFYIHTEEDWIIFAGSSENYLGKQKLNGMNMIPWDGISEGYHFKLQLPHMQKHPTNVERIDVVVSGTINESLQKLESLENVAFETFRIKKPIIYLKTVTRTVVKGVASESAKQEMTKNMDSTMAFFSRLVTDVLVDQTENADLRISRFFPSEVAIGEIHLDEGLYDITVNYYNSEDSLLHSDSQTNIKLKANHINLLESAYLN